MFATFVMMQYRHWKISIESNAFTGYSIYAIGGRAAVFLCYRCVRFDSFLVALHGSCSILVKCT